MYVCIYLYIYIHCKIQIYYIYIYVYIVKYILHRERMTSPSFLLSQLFPLSPVLYRDSEWTISIIAILCQVASVLLRPLCTSSAGWWDGHIGAFSIIRPQRYIFRSGFQFQVMKIWAALSEVRTCPASLLYLFLLLWLHPSLNAIWMLMSSTFATMVLAPEIQTHISNCLHHLSSECLIETPSTTCFKICDPFPTHRHASSESSPYQGMEISSFQ